MDNLNYIKASKASNVIYIFDFSVVNVGNKIYFLCLRDDKRLVELTMIIFTRF